MASDYRASRGVAPPTPGSISVEAAIRRGRGDCSDDDVVVFGPPKAVGPPMVLIPVAERDALRQQLAAFRAFVRAWDAKQTALFRYNPDLEAAHEAGKAIRQARAAIADEWLDDAR